ncbi:esterase-like activity of phytase family protein [Conexibacter sp. JD483]|uniref:esterase-like activity of phytase family protein n=1 Tax=unclassified Conexibacter TaxID=2627773 RepID=UPI0027271F01|nr:MULTISPECIES: esterase-like activity of phytase family protein [unclassified Conexibacter]MDO8185344.1 esterase-like activity of phytase family protein [Conexibacter sp. CPCC 205706]MDO8198480.1 esterase-like activity of phytase family protein [Conexibacter sp. CPCC 205762]MDR9368755.1 esterase-like activity of phytase family protein [Conexibacter sp. JD483]
MKITTTLAAAVGAALALAAPASGAALSDPTEAGRYELARDLVLPTPTLTDASPIISVGDAAGRRGIREGGLSALQVVPGSGNRRFISISDRGPNGAVDGAVGGRSYPSPGFSPIIYELEADDSGRLDVLSRKQVYVPAGDPIRQQDQFRGDSQLISGIRNVVTTGVDDRTYLMASDTTLSEFTPTDPYGLDSEGIQRDPRDGSYWISDEYRPSILHVARDGQLLARIVPDGAGDLDTDPTAATVPLSSFYGGIGQPLLQQILPREYNARRMNRGLEGLALSPDGTKLYAMMQNSLDTGRASLAALGYGTACGPAGDAGSDTPASSNWWRDLRIVELDVADGGVPRVTGEWVYRLDSLSTTRVATQAFLRVSDIAWTGSRRLIVDEHDDVNTAKNGRKLFEVDLNQATNLMAAGSYDTYAERQAPVTVGSRTQPLGCFLDNGSADELSQLATPVTPTPKSVYLSLGFQRDGGVEFLQGKIEGIAPLQGIDGIAIVNDNDFGFDQNATTNIFSAAADPASQLRVYTSRPQVSGGGPAVSGSAKAGRTLTCAPGDFSGSGTLSTAIAWLRNGSEIAGAEGTRLTLSAEDVGATIACRVTATRRYGAVRAVSAPADSAATAAVADFDRGADGQRGDTGAQGPRGDNGAQGPRGDTGSAGRDGANGAKGDSGAAGPKGDGGPAGPEGDSGPAGPQGERGPAGPTPRVSCTLVKRKRVIAGVRCKVSASRAATIVARRGGRTLARATAHRGSAALRLPATARRVTFAALDRHGKTLARVTVKVRR